MSNFISKADIFMMAKHNGQKRKLSGDPYWIHPKRVAAMAIEIGHSENFIAGCLLHDVVEDCEVHIDTIGEIFGADVKRIVAGMTNTSKKDFPLLNRKARKELDHKRISECEFDIKYLKFLDRYDNMNDMLHHVCAHNISYKLEQEGWFWLYVRETRELIEAIGLPYIGKYNLSNLVDRLEFRLKAIQEIQSGFEPIKG